MVKKPLVVKVLVPPADAATWRWRAYKAKLPYTPYREVKRG